MRSILSLSALALIPLALASCSSANEPERSPGSIAKEQQPIAGGQADPYHTSVLGMFTLSGYGGGMCSGTLIAPNLVLTARHCVSSIQGDSEYVICGQSPFGPPYPGDNIYVTNDQQMSQYSDNWWQGAEVRVPSEGKDTCGFDMALVILGQSVPESVTKPYIPRIDIPPAAGEMYQAVGYGSTGFGGGGTRMIRGNLGVQCSPGVCSQWEGVAQTEWRGETGICQGDSGGPALDLQDKVIGVVSRGGQGCSTPVYGSVSAWREWIMQVALEAAQKGGYDPPFWALSGKSDPDTEPPIEPGTGGSGATSSGGSGGESGAASGGTAGEQPDPQGQPCDGTCPNGYLCYDDGTGAFCAQACSVDANSCGPGLGCTEVSGQGVCLNASEPSADSSGGCSVVSGRERGPAKPVPWVAALAAGAAWLVRRRRR